MRVTGIICEFNPFHDGHKYLIEQAKELTGSDYTVCLMITKTKVGPVYVFLFHFDSFFLTFHFMCFILQLDRVAVKISSFLNHYFLL